MSASQSLNILSYFHGIDPAAAIIRDGVVAAYVEEERLIRYKHAANMFPVRSIGACLDIAGLSIADIDFVVYGWDAHRYAGGGMAEFYAKVNEEYPPNGGTRAWQQRNVSLFSPAGLESRLTAALVPFLGVAPEDLPPMVFYPHHEDSRRAGVLYVAVRRGSRTHG